jgi:hypothetical protein
VAESSADSARHRRHGCHLRIAVRAARTLPMVRRRFRRTT